MLHEYTINNVPVSAIGQYLPSELEMHNYVEAARKMFGGSLEQVIISCGLDNVSAYFVHDGGTKHLFRSRRLIRPTASTENSK